MNQPQDNKKQHKINSKLRKKRQQLKEHKKQKKMTKQKYNPQDAKMKFFQQTNTVKQGQDASSQLHKLKVWLYRFVKVFDDDMEDFYEIWRNLDEGGEVNIQDIQNEEIKKILSKICKCLPLTKIKQKYAKQKDSKVNLGSYVKIKTQQILEECLIKDSLSQYAESQCDNEEKTNKLTKVKKIKSKINEDQQQKVEEQKIQKKPKQLPAKREYRIQNKNAAKICQIMNKIPRQQKLTVKKSKYDQIDKIFNQINKQAKNIPQRFNSQSQLAQNLIALKKIPLNPNVAFKSLQSVSNQHSQAQKESHSLKPTQPSNVPSKTNKKRISLQTTRQDPNKLDLLSFKESIKDGYVFNFSSQGNTSTSKNRE